MCNLIFMGRIEWKKEYSVGVKMFDEQHRVFFGIINSLYDAIIARRDQEVLDDIFRSLFRYTDFHFKSEEQYFDEFQYDHAEEHRLAHEALSRRVAELREKQIKGQMESSYELLDFLEDWLVEHIMGMDKQYGPCFRAHGLQ